MITISTWPCSLPISGERISQFDNKLYLEFGGKLFDDYHASRVLPGFQPDSKLQMLLQLKDQAEIVVVISAEDIISNKMRGDYGITYDQDVLRLIDAFQGMGLFVGSVCITMYTAAPEVEAFERRLNELNIRTFRHYKIAGYPNDVTHIVSDDGYGKMITSKPSAHWSLSRLPAPAAAKWPSACPSCTMNTSAASRLATPNLKHSPSGTFPSSTQSTLLTKLLPPT